jgi:DNA-binding transcriptional MocR family regulator
VRELLLEVELRPRLGVSRGVVTDAFEQLAAEGCLAVGERLAPTVAEVVAMKPVGPDPPASSWRFDMGAVTPDVGLFPRPERRRAMEWAVRTAPDAALEYADHRGAIELRTALSDYLGRVRGVRVDPSRIIITQGFTHSVAAPPAHAAAAHTAQSLDDLELVEEASRHGISVTALSGLHLARQSQRGLLPGYGRLPEPSIEAAVEALAEALARTLGECDPHKPTRTRAARRSTALTTSWSDQSGCERPPLARSRTTEVTSSRSSSGAVTGRRGWTGVEQHLPRGGSRRRRALSHQRCPRCP